MIKLNFKEVGKYGKILKVLQFKKIYKPLELPNNNKKDIVFWGKSNVGKSSLINTLLNYKINKVSKKPGCTKWIGFLELPHINIIDLPGYGYSNVAKGRKEFWDKMLQDYIDLKRTEKVFILIDSNRFITDIDYQAKNCFACSDIKFIYTKADKKMHHNENFLISIKTGLNIINFRDILANL